ncbi:MAG TPA: MoaD/ThiS family protein [Dehalococcoidales bacterium]
MIKINLEYLSWLSETLVVQGSGESLRREQEVEEGQTVRHLLVQLANQYPRFERSAFDTKLQKISEKVFILYQGRLLELADGLETQLKDGDSLVFVPVIQGG